MRNPQRLMWLAIALLLIGLSWYRVAAAQAGLVVRAVEGEIPLVFVAPRAGENLPGVLIAHGFAGSKQLMLGYAYSLAWSGYGVLLWDFNGHGANPTPFEFTRLQQNLDTALAALVAQPEVDPNRLALLGHSMGSSVVMTAGVNTPNRYAATVAVSPIKAQVTPQVPRNLQLQAGSWEGNFVANAQRLLEAAGGENQNLAAGIGRSLLIIPSVEHITILFSSLSHQAALNWLNATFRLPAQERYSDRRMTWYGVHLAAWLMVIGVISSFWVWPSKVKKRPMRSWGGLLLSPLAATAVLVLVNLRGEIESFGGVLVGGALGLWFLAAGVVWLVIQGWLLLPKMRMIALGLLLFVLLWAAFGAMAQVVWLQWWLIPARLKLWLMLSTVCLPWFVASGVAQQGLGVSRRVLWWLGQSAVLVGGFILTIVFLPQLGFMVLLLPVFPLLIAILSLAAASFKDVWSYALGSTLFFGWAMAAAFPLVP